MRKNRALHRVWRKDQGHSKFKYAEPGEEAVDSVGVFAEGGGEVGGFSESEEVDGGVAEGGEVVGSAGAADAATVLAPVSVANPMLAILDAPMASPQGEQPGRISAPGRQAGNGVLHLASLLAAAMGRAF